MSRLVPMVDVKPNQLAYFYLVEIEKTRLYLMSQRLINGETPLQMVLPALDNSHHEIAKSISQDQGLECKTVDILAYAKNINLAESLIKPHPELLHMQLLANGNVPDNLAPQTYSKIHSLNNTCRILYMATAAVAVLGIGLAGFYAWQGRQQHNQLDLVAAQTQQQQRLYDEVAKNFPSTPIPSAELKVAVDLAQTIQANSQTPAQFMQILSAACETAPEINLNRMRWLLSTTPDVVDEAANSIMPANQPYNQSPTADPTKLVQVGFVNAEIKGFTGDYRAALNTVSQFVNTLKSNPTVETVTILQEPVNVSSLANLQGSTTDETATERPPAIFKLKIVLKPQATNVTNAALNTAENAL